MSDFRWTLPDSQLMMSACVSGMPDNALAKDESMPVVNFIRDAFLICYVGVFVLVILQKIKRPLLYLVHWIARILYYPIVVLFVVLIPASVITVFASLVGWFVSFLTAPIGIKPDYITTGVGALAGPVLFTTIIVGIVRWITRWAKDRPLPKSPPPKYSTFEIAQLWWAQARAVTYERDQRHLCLEFNCREVVVGEAFAHCNRHLAKFERRWMETGIDPAHLLASASSSGHNPAFGVRSYLERRHARRNAVNKKRALKHARSLLDRHFRRTAAASGTQVTSSQ